MILCGVLPEPRNRMTCTWHLMQGSAGSATGRLATGTRASRLEHGSGARGSGDRAASGAGDGAAPAHASRASRVSHGEDLTQLNAASGHIKGSSMSSEGLQTC